MTKDLVERLRDGCNLQQRDGEKAADRIEQLERELADCMREAKNWREFAISQATQLAAEKALAIDCQRTTEEMASMWAKEKALADQLYSRLKDWCELPDVSEWKDKCDINALAAYRKARGL